MALFERIFQYLDLEHEIVDAPDARRLRPRRRCDGRVTFGDVSFRYEEPRRPRARAARTAPVRARREWTLEGIDLEIEPGQLAALVGPSGAGKTTISYLVPRLYERDRGRRRDRRRRRARHRAGVAGRLDRDGHAGDVPLPHDGAREPALRAARRDRGGDRGRGTRRRTSTSASSSSTRRATTRSSASAATACRAARSSGSRSPASCSRIRGS